MTPKQERFVSEYLIDLNAAQAYIRAGYIARGNSAEVNGVRLLRNAQVSAAIQSAKKTRAQELGIDAAWVLKTLHAEKTADLADLYTTEGALKPVHEWPEVWRRGPVIGVESFEEYGFEGGARVAIGMVRKVKFADRTRHLEMIGKHTDVQAFREKIEHTGAGGGPIQSVSMTQEEFARIAADVAAKV